VTLVFMNIFLLRHHMRIMQQVRIWEWYSWRSQHTPCIGWRPWFWWAIG